MNQRELEETLQELGRLHVEPLDEAGTTRIAQHWRKAAATPASISPRHRRPAAGRVRRPAIIGASALVLAAAASVAVVFSVHSTPPNDAAIVSDAQGVTVILPNGEVIAPLAGEGLPVGAIVEAGANASGRIGNSVLLPRARYIVGKNGLEIAPDDVPTPTVASSRPVSTVPSSTVAGPTSTSQPSGPTTTSVAATTPPEPVTSAPPSAVAPARLSVAVSAKGKKARISWTRSGSADVKQYVVIRVRSWNGSTLPKGKRIATIRRGASLTAVDPHPQPETFYVVAALGPKRTVLAIGSVQAPTIPTR